MTAWMTFGCAPAALSLAKDRSGAGGRFIVVILTARHPEISTNTAHNPRYVNTASHNCHFFQVWLRGPKAPKDPVQGLVFVKGRWLVSGIGSDARAQG